MKQTLLTISNEILNGALFASVFVIVYGVVMLAGKEILQVFLYG